MRAVGGLFAFSARTKGPGRQTLAVSGKADFQLPVIKSKKRSWRRGLALLLCPPPNGASFADIYKKVYS
jgi:hypothetical protein